MKCDVLSWRQENQRAETTLWRKRKMVLREIVDDHRFLESKTCAWWRNEPLQMRNLTSGDRQSLICKRVRGCKVINNNHTRHASLIGKDILSIRNWSFEDRSGISQTKEHSSDWVGWDQESHW